MLEYVVVVQVTFHSNPTYMTVTNQIPPFIEHLNPSHRI